ncbi:VOC family protein [Shumkonia mesophila]|uniref:VOC family protein n=1 Tax=Shumkonia mesophila TaxID=2838854 RepID=UPI00293449D3|nr:VOC family protein [Shumkonia mesophila]
MQVQPYLFFNGRCEEAIEFYRKALGAEVEMLVRFKDSPDEHPPEMGEIDPESVMHATLKIGDAVLLASDGCGNEPTSFKGFSLSLTATSKTEADRFFNALADGGEVQMPLGETFFSPRFGMLTDRFGVSWMIYVAPAATAAAAA